MKTIMNAVVTAGVGVISAVIVVVGAQLRELILKKKDQIALKTGIDKYNSNKNTALEVWKMIDEKFRITPTLEKTFENKAAEFDKTLKTKIPDLTDEQIKDLRQTIAGEINKDRTAVTSDAIAQQTELNNIKTENTQLQNENAQLKQTISSVQATLQPQSSATTAANTTQNTTTGTVEQK